MGVLPNDRHEIFAQGRSRGMTIDAAYQAAGFRANASNASRLNRNEQIQSRIAELQAQAAEVAKIDAAWVLAKAAVLHEKAMDAGAFSAAKGALDLIGKHVEVQAFREQVQHSGMVEYRNLSDDEIDARIAALMANAERPTAH
ncbi:hypothetical protein [Sphingomonas sp.]|jgi:phage terminase small subunit|uniref:hypothetical protein n=1 Tax=Sphingomonas sp. TaxID=28214 RepID=UPI0035C7CE9F